MSVRSRFWDRMYERGTATWDLGAADPELLATLEAREVAPGRAIDLGCGTGDNAIALAQLGFEVTAVDLAGAALAQAREKAATAGVQVEFRTGDVTDPHQLEGPFDLIVDRGLLMSLLGERARRAYTTTVTRLAGPAGHVYQHQWALPEAPPALSRARLLVHGTKGFVLASGELERRLGHDFHVETLSRSVEPADDPGIRRLGIRHVAKTTSWLTRRSDEEAPSAS